MKNRKLLIVCVGIIILIIFVITNSVNEQKNISIGAVIPQTGFGAYWGKPVLAGIKLAEKELKDKYGESNVRIIIEDGQSAVAASVSAAQKLLSINKVDALYSEFSGPSSAISPIAKEFSKAFVYSTFNQKIVEQNKGSIKTFISFELGCEKLAKYLNDQSKRILIVSSIGDVAPYCERALLRFYPKENVKVVDGFIGTDFRTLLLQNKAYNPDYIIPIMYEEGSFALLKQMGELGLNSKVYSYKQDSATEKILKGLPVEYTDGSLFFAVPIDEEFSKKMKAIDPSLTEDDLQGAANSYQSIMVLGNALAECVIKDVECVVSRIKDLKQIASKGYKNISFVDRVIQSDLQIGEVQNGIAIIK